MMGRIINIMNGSHIMKKLPEYRIDFLQQVEVDEKRYDVFQEMENKK